MASYNDSTASQSQTSMTREERKVIVASSLGTVFEWYDFYLYGSLAAIIGAQFFNVLGPDGKPLYDEATRNIFALLAFAAGFIVRPFGALVFGRIGDLVGRKRLMLGMLAVTTVGSVVSALVATQRAPRPTA